MIGNYIIANVSGSNDPRHAVLCKVIELGIYRATLVAPNKNKHFFVDYQKAVPIVLTQEIIEKCGFISMGLVCEGFPITTIDDNEYPCWSLFDSGKETNIKVAFVDGVMRIWNVVDEINYSFPGTGLPFLHNLQNYLGLEDIELKVAL